VTLYEYILRPIDPFLGRELQANNETVAVSVQRSGKHTSTTIELLLGKHFPAEIVTNATRERGYFLRSQRRGVKKKRIGATSFQLSIES
jgi:hypothetical protein